MSTEVNEHYREAMKASSSQDLEKVREMHADSHQRRMEAEVHVAELVTELHRMKNERDGALNKSDEYLARANDAETQGAGLISLLKDTEHRLDEAQSHVLHLTGTRLGLVASVRTLSDMVLDGEGSPNVV